MEGAVSGSHEPPSHTADTMRRRLARLLLLAAVLGGPRVARANDEAPDQEAPASPGFVLFSSTSLSYLIGFHWDTPFAPTARRDVLTLEHSQVNTVGDVYLFADLAHLATYGRGDPGAGVDLYGEVTVRLSASKITGTSLELGPIADVLYAGSFELGRSGTLSKLNRAQDTHLNTLHMTQLHGGSLDVEIPGFQFAQLSGYWRDNLDLPGSTYQLTCAWQLPIVGGRGPLSVIFAGFADLAGPEAWQSVSFHSAPQLLMGRTLTGLLAAAYVGVELEIWLNEFGVAGQDELVPQAVAMARF